MTLSIIGEQMETEESFILHFRGLQILHEMICSNEYLGGDRSQLEVEIREVMDAALQIQSQMSHDASTPIFFTMILKQVASIVRIFLLSDINLSRATEQRI